MENKKKNEKTLVIDFIFRNLFSLKAAIAPVIMRNRYSKNSTMHNDASGEKKSTDKYIKIHITMAQVNNIMGV
ncbi:hypothetical protein NXX12_19180 [Phocaeicola vulgatus]|uniref:hypothetical protein n=1 Tax=Phocaeicola vulgatus TaxID=821 RepID=UPI00216528D2|nr:hypothetical protein [Phocaeicola vulgatus]MCS2372189.1 hypothetical protein [Phocaeicola vulgatus]MCS2409790.1 hypothetical protein [Phocaeicola vulgatus]MCS2662878.1 hypothetical protein [Phocaeicola vulgatus]MCS2907051.1 hypothetical protein [Phocaeicola vulgatus]MCS3022319.1 hypothetical protein [Phocaeicola vulgatus]